MRPLFLIALCGVVAPAAGQEAAPLVHDVEEVIVPGRSPENLRIEVERLEAAVYERFNALNSNDEFDVHCLEQAPTGSNIPVRTCAPNFVIQAESRAAKRRLTDARGGRSALEPADRLLMEQKSRELTAEMQRIAREDERLLRDLVRLDELMQLQSRDRRERAERGRAPAEHARDQSGPGNSTTFQ